MGVDLMPRRHPTLVSLSHDHHHGLALALRLRQGNKALLTDGWTHDRREQARRVQHFFRDDLATHFRVEEEILFPAMQEHIASASDLVLLLIAQHREMEKLISQLRGAHESLLDPLLIELGILLEQHIRSEERDLFPMFEHHMPATVAAEVGETIRRRELELADGVRSGRLGTGTSDMAILITEDEDEVRELLAMSFEAEGFRVFTAADGRSALKLLLDRKGDIGLLITDLGLPHLGGMELIQQAREAIPSLKVIAASGYGHFNVREQLLRLGVEDFFPKPYSPNELLAIAKRMMREERE